MDRYRIVLRPKEGRSEPSSIEELHRRLARIPTVERDSERSYRFGEADHDGQLEFALQGGEGERFEWVEFSIPRGWVPRRGPQVFALVFMVRDWLGHEAYDPQIEDVLQKEAVLQGLVAMRQREIDQRGRS